MFHFRPKGKNNSADDKVKDLNRPLDSQIISSSLEENISEIKKLFEDNEIIRFRSVQNNTHNEYKYGIVYCDGVVNTIIINENIIKPLVLSTALRPGNDSIDVIVGQVVPGWGNTVADKLLWLFGN